MFSVNNCIFCKIIEGTQQATVVYQDDNVIVFNDIKPSASHHYLICPKRHINNAKGLTQDDKPIVENLYTIGKQKLNELGIDFADARFGFHWPPFNSIQHLHLHLIAPVSEMSFISQLIFKPNSFWFVTPEYVINKLSEGANDTKSEISRNNISKM